MGIYGRVLVDCLANQDVEPSMKVTYLPGQFQVAVAYKGKVVDGHVPATEVPNGSKLAMPDYFSVLELAQELASQVAPEQRFDGAGIGW